MTHEHKEVEGESEEVDEEAAGRGKGHKGNDGVGGFVNRFVSTILNAISKTLRSFVAFSLAMFFLGALFGHFVPQFADKLGLNAGIVLAAPLVLSVLSYYFTEVAVIVFLLMFGLFLVFFL